MITFCAWSLLAEMPHPPAMPGELSPRAKLTEEDVLEIRALRGIVPQSTLASRFGVSKTAIRYAQTGRNWRCVRQFPEAR